VTPEQIVGAIVGALIVIGGGTMAIFTLFKKFGIGTCPDVCPEPQCQDLVRETRDNAKLAKENAATAADAVVKSIISLQAGMKSVEGILEQKRVKIEGLQTDTTEIKTDVKWIVREIRKRNDLK
jgi:hypothetical protein